MMNALLSIAMIPKDATISNSTLVYLLIAGGVILIGLIAVIVGLFIRLKQLEKHQYNDELELSAEIEL